MAPYDETISVGGVLERYERGVFTEAPHVAIYWNHDIESRGGSTPIGRVQEYRETERGLEVVAKIAATSRGDEVYTLLKEGVLNSLSANFIPTQARSDGDVTVYEKAELLEVSVVGRSAYPSAKISEVRSDNTKEKEVVSGDTTQRNMTEVTYDDSEIRSGLDSLEREIGVLKENGVVTSPRSSAWTYRSAGELAAGITRGDEAAKAELRAYTGATLADSQLRPGWVDAGLKFIAANRIGYNLFQHLPLASDGMSFVIPTATGSTGSVDVQASEGSPLNYNKVTTGTQTISVQTIGGYVELSFQVKDRSSIDYYNASLQLLALNYAKKTNSLVANAVTAASGVNTGTGLTLSSSTAAQWQNFVDEGVSGLSDNAGVLPEFMWVSRDVFYKLKGFVDTTGRPLMEINNDGSNTIGSANPVAVSGTWSGVKLVVDPALAAKTAILGNSTAATIWEAPGAPFKLDDQNITNLTVQAALYGYVAVGVTNPKGLFKVAVA